MSIDRLLPEPMLAAKMTGIPTGPGWLMEPKCDGWRALAGILGGDRGVRMETRTGNAITQVPYIADALRAHFPPGTIVDGELVDLASGARQWNRTQTILSKTRGGYQHRPKRHDPALTYVLFDVLQVKGLDVRRQILIERKQQLVALATGIEQATGGLITLSPVQTPSEEGLEALIEFGFEGVVVKRVNSPYIAGRRGGWGKIKPELEIEAVCTGTYPPKQDSKYALPEPWAVGGLRFRVEYLDGRVYEGRAAGMDDELRRELHEHPQRFVGKVVELVHWGVQPTGALRHPQYRRFRSDAEKPAPTVQQRPAIAAASASRNTAVARTAASGRPRMRNYGAMRDTKLLDCIDSLRSESGDAYTRCVNSGGDPAEDLAVAERVARERNLL